MKTNLAQDYYMAFTQNSYDMTYATWTLRNPNHDDYIHYDTPITGLAGPVILREDESYDPNIEYGQVGEFHEWFQEFIIHEKYANLFSVPNIYGLQVYPAVLVDAKDNWHEDYELLHFHKFIDCLDFDRSEIDDREEIGKERVIIRKHVLDSEKLAQYPEQERLAFRLGGMVRFRPHFFHKKLVDKLVSAGLMGVRFMPVEDYTPFSQYLDEEEMREEPDKLMVIDRSYPPLPTT